jgi:DNA-binding transcriptional regulator GbsR (MarR family)
MLSTTQSTSLEPWEISIIDSFVRAASLIGLPRSIGEIYGVVYCSAEPINFEQIVERLGISRGSVSQGLKTLRQIGAVRTHYLPGIRIDHYIAELSMERLVRGFLKDQFTPHLESSQQRLAAIKDQVAAIAAAPQRAHAAARLNTLKTWQARVRKLLPVILTVLSGVQAFSKEEPPADII